MLLGPGSSVPRPVGMTTLAAALIGLGATSPAIAATGGGASSAPSSSPAAAPAISSIACLAGCGTGGAVAQGGKLALSGRQLDRATGVVFLGGSGARDDVRATLRSARATRAEVVVPASARSGRIALVTTAGVVAQAAVAPLKLTSPATKELLAGESVMPVLKPVKGLAQVEAGIAKRRVAKAGVSSVTVAYVARGAEQAVRVDVVRRSDGLSIFSDERTAAADETQTLTWSGRGNDGAGLAGDGKYDVRISAGGQAGPRATPEPATLSAGGASPTAAPTGPQGTPPPTGASSLGAFTFVGAVFPVRGKHNYGQGGARFGAGRSGHSHEGQDVMAQCGTPVVAARGGVVKNKATHSAAGNYVIITDAATGQDHGYMHFRAPAVVDRGEAVETGQVIGYVGSTGSSTACHLHFEIWTAPGWYSGGSAIDPLATLKRWDKLG